MNPVDFSLYLVTDSTQPILGNRDLVSVVSEAIKGGVTVVQLRDKHSDTAQLIEIAKKLRKVTRDHQVPFIINDRVDVAAAVDADGCHLGQTDMGIAHARSILGPGKLIGVTASSPQEAIIATRAGADYLGLGTAFATTTKDSKSIIGPSGVRAILTALVGERPIRTVCIGGINARNVQRVLFQTSGQKHLDGVAVVSAIIGAERPGDAAAQLRSLINQPFLNADSSPDLLANVSRVLRQVITTKPLNHNMTNHVVQNFAANIALAVGSSPIMSVHGNEVDDLAALGGCLVINMGTMDSVQDYVAGVNAYNAARNPVLLDPVGAGATAPRRALTKALLDHGFYTVIKGNESEILTVAGIEVKQHGVDGAESLSKGQKIEVVRKLAAREHNVILMTGQTDFVSDGKRTITVTNGHKYLSQITGSGCCLGTTIAACLAVERDALLATLSGLLLYEIAAEKAAIRADVFGPGTFVAAFIDEIYRLQHSDYDWIQEARFETVQ